MAFILKDRVKENSTTTGTGNISLGGASATFDTFQSYLTNGDTTFYAIAHTSSGVDEWEVGLGTWNTGNTLSRTTVLAGSNGTSAVDLSAGTKDIFMTYPASKAAVVGEDVTFADITVTGTVDGRDVATDGSKLDGIDTSADVTDAVTVAAAGALMRSGGTMTGNLILNTDPNAALGAATKQYVDTIASAGIHYHAPVRAEHPSNLNATYNNGSSGVGATLTNAGTNAALVIDSVSMVLNDRVLVANQTNQTQNGVYTVTTVGDGSTAWVLTRSTDTDTAAPSDPDAFGKGDAFFIKEGSTNAGHLDVLSTAGTIVFGTTNIVFSEVAETTVYSGGTGITLTGTTFSIGQDVATSANVTFNQVTAAIIGNVTGNLTGDVTGNADTATALETARTIQLSGDVTGSASFDGSANINITAAVQDDSHAHVISNVDGLQSALDAKVPTSRIITAGNGLTGGGDLSANRTLTVGGGSGITVNANDIAIDSSYTGFDSRYVNVTGDIMTGDLQAAGLYVGSSNTSYDFYNNGTTYLNGATTIDANTTINGHLGIGGTATDTAWSDDLYGNTEVSIDGGGGYGVLHFRGDGSGTTNTRYSIGVGDSIFYMAYDDVDGVHRAQINAAHQFLVNEGSGNQRVFHDGYHPNADKWTTSRTLSLSGDASGSVSWDGSANATLSVTVANDSHTHSWANITNGQRYGYGTQLRPDSASSYGGFQFIGSNGASAGYLLQTGGSVTANTTYLPNGITLVADQSWLSLVSRTTSNTGVRISTGVTPVVRQTIDSSGNIDFTGASFQYNNNNIWHAGNDGSGSGLDADLLDGYHESSFIRKGVGYTWTATGNSNLLRFQSENAIDTASAYHASLEVFQDNAGHDAFMAFHIGGDYAAYFGLHGGINDFVVGGWSKGATYQRVFHDGYHPNADTLTTARTINGVSFNGSANITVADSTKLPLSGGTMTGDLTISGGAGAITLNNSDIRSAQSNPTWTGNPGTVGKIQYHSNRWYIVADQSSNRIVQFRRDGSDKSYIDNNGDLQSGKAAGWITSRTLSLTGAVTGSVSWDGTGNASLSTSFNDNGPNYIDVATGNYGTVKVDDDRGVSGGWAGYAIRDDWVFMSNGAGEAGIYNDTDNEWAILCLRNADTRLYHNGSESLRTIGINGIRVGAPSHSSSDIYMSDADHGERRIHCNSNRIGFLNSSNGWGAYSEDSGNWIVEANLTAKNRLDVGTGTQSDAEIRIYKADNNVSDHIQFYNGTTRIGEIGCQDTSWLRINQVTAKNIYTPRYIRADGGFFVDDTTKGINGSGNFIGGTIAGASDYSTLLRSNANDTFTGQLTMGTQLALVAGNFGRGVFGLYSSTRYQHVWSMGTSYKTSDDGTSYGNMYGLTYTHTNIGTGTNQSISGLSHQLQHRRNGTLTAAIGDGIWTSGNVTAYSDIAVKTNLVKIPNALEKVCSLNGYTYERTDYVKDEEDPEAPEVLRQAGVVAQEVEKVLPEVVSGKDGNKAVAYGNMVSILIEAIKEQQEQINELKKRLK